MTSITDPERRALDTVPVLNDDGSVLLYDMFVDEAWIGSRRTLPQCDQAFEVYRR